MLTQAQIQEWKVLIERNWQYIEEIDNTVLVTNPVSGRSVKLKDFSNKHNRTLWNLLSKAKREKFFKGPNSSLVRSILAQGIRQGRVFYNFDRYYWDGIPHELSDGAWDLLAREYGLSGSVLRGKLLEKELPGHFSIERSIHKDGTVVEIDLENISPMQPSSSTSSTNNQQGTKRPASNNDVVQKQQKKIKKFHPAQVWDNEYAERYPYVETREAFYGTSASYMVDMVWLNYKKDITQDPFAHLYELRKTVKKLIETNLARFAPQMRVLATYFCVMGKPTMEPSQQQQEETQNQDLQEEGTSHYVDLEPTSKGKERLVDNGDEASLDVQETQSTRTLPTMESIPQTNYRLSGGWVRDKHPNRISRIAQELDQSEDFKRVVEIAVGQAEGGEKLIVTRTSSTGKLVMLMIEEFLRGISEEQARGSNWRWERSIRWQLKFIKYELMQSQNARLEQRQAVVPPAPPPPPTTSSSTNIDVEQQNTRRLMNQLAERQGIPLENQEDFVGYGSTFSTTACKTPPWLLKKKAIVNIHNQDDQCFRWALLRGLYWDDSLTHRQRQMTWDLEKHFNEIRFPPGLEPPFKANNRVFEKVETLNKERFTFSVFYLGAERMEIEPWYLSQWKLKLRGNRHRVPHFRLGYIDNLEARSHTPNQPGHYVLIYNWKALCKRTPKNSGGHSQRRINKETLEKEVYHYDYCERCLCNFAEDRIDEHEDLCRGNKPCSIVMPKPGSHHHQLTFHHWKHKLPNPFVIYADFEALLTIGQRSTFTLSEEGTIEKNAILNKHEPCGWAYYIWCRYEKHKEAKQNFLPYELPYPVLENPNQTELYLCEVRSYFGPDAVTMFLHQLQQDMQVIKSIMETQRDPVLDTSDPWSKECFEKETKCWVCKQPFLRNAATGEYQDKVWDHDHFTGLYRGAAHTACNLQISELPKGEKKTRMNRFRVPVYFHNFTGYDCFHLIKGVGKTSARRMDCIAKSMQKFSTITLDNYQFLDSKAFLNGSLDKNVRILYNSVKSDPAKLYRVFKPVLKYFCSRIQDENTPSRFWERDLFKKGVYPYEYMDSAEKLKETCLPPRECFQSSLTGTKMYKNKDFVRAQRMWDAMGCKTMKDYTRYYCILDVLLLGCVFQEFRASCLDRKSYGLDPSYYVSIPSLSWDAMLLKNACRPDPVVIETLTDPNMLLMVEKGIRGGICQVMLPKAQANYPGLKSPIGPEDEDYLGYRPEKENSILLYFDANNLYGWAMCQYLPLDQFEWVYDAEWETVGEGVDLKEYGIFVDPESTKAFLDDLVDNQWDEKHERGYLLEVDLSYPTELHCLHNDYPMAPTNKSCNECSDYTRDLALKIEINDKKKIPKSGMPSSVGSDKLTKLVLDFTPKNHYVIHYKLLQFYLKHGLKLEYVHRVIQFRQKPWLKAYVDYNTRKRKKAKEEKNDIASDMYKLLTNGIYGKSMEQVRKRRNVLLFNQPSETLTRKLNHPLMKDFNIIGTDQLIVLEMQLSSVIMNKPISVGQAILDLSKLHMYRFHYEVMLPRFGIPKDGDRPRARLCYTDTDSLIYWIKEDPSLRKSVWQELHELQRQSKSFDLSENIAPDHPWLMSYGEEGRLDPKDGAKVLGKFKNEMAFDMVEFIGLRSKMYSCLQSMDNYEGTPYHSSLIKEASGKMQKNVKKGIHSALKITHLEYRKAYEGHVMPRVESVVIAHDKNFHLYTRKDTKQTINACDDKSFWLDRDTPIRYGHFILDMIANVDD